MTRHHYLTAHPSTAWGDLEYSLSPLWEEGYDLCAIKPNGVLVFKRRAWIIKVLRRILG